MLICESQETFRSSLYLCVLSFASMLILKILFCFLSEIFMFPVILPCGGTNQLLD